MDRIATFDRGPIDVVYDGLGGPRTGLLGELLAPRGHVVFYGFAAGATLTLQGVALYRKGARLSFYQVFHYTGVGGGADAVAALGRARAFLERGVASGALRPELGQIFDLEEVVAAHRHAEGRAARGKTIVLARSPRSEEQP